MKMQIRAPAGDGGRRKKKKCGEMIVGGTEKISSFLSRSWFLVPGSCPLFTSRVTSFLTAISCSESGPPTLSRSSTYVCFVRRSFAIVVFAHSPYHSPDHNHSNL